MDRVCFTVNGVPYSVGSEVSSSVTLVDYIRDHLELRGTKYMCRQAGCGACIVACTDTEGTVRAVNSCMVSITSCDGWKIETIEEVGNRKKGYHAIQKVLADHNGSQCGHCSPGWVMAMYSLLQEKKDLTMLNIEKSFASNVCRCTGYRPILDAFKSFAKDAKPTDINDIEDLSICDKTGNICTRRCSSDDEDWCLVTESDITEDKVKVIQLSDNKKWFRVDKLSQVNQILKQEGLDSYMLVAGNTAKGAYPISEYPNTLIDITGLPELKTYLMDQNLVIGAGVTLTELLNIYKTVSDTEYFEYLSEFYDHLQLVAHIAVRNLGTIGGNLMIKHEHNEFQSDLYLMFETVGAVLTILIFETNTEILVTMDDFLKLSMKGAIIINVRLPPLGSDYRVKTYKVMPRSQSAHAIVNFGSLYKYSNDCIIKDCRLLFGGLSPGFTRAKITEKQLIGKQLFKNETIQSAVQDLLKELVVTESPPEPSVEYRTKLAVGLFYKSLLSLCPDTILDKRFKSGAVKLIDERPTSTSQRSFDTKQPLWPVTKPMPKLEALLQCAGEASYTDDVPSFPHQVYGELVLSTVAKGTILAIDTKQALAYPGVLAVYTAKDIPGLNSFTPTDETYFSVNEEVLCSGEVMYYNQPIALVVAETRYAAAFAAHLVQASYGDVSKPVLDLKVAKMDPNRTTLYKSVDATDKGSDVTKVINGSNTVYGQYHFTMETLASAVRSTEEGLELFVSTQFPTAVQSSVSKALNISANRVDVHVRRIGGGFGIKISRSILGAVCASLAATILGRPCRVIHSMRTVTHALGKRLPCSNDFEVAVNNSGTIQYLSQKNFSDNGFLVNEDLTQTGLDVYFNVYDKTRWNHQILNVITDTAKNTWCRSPGTLETIAMTEMIMEQISYELSLDPIQVRLANLDPQYKAVKEMLDLHLTETNYVQRKEEIKKYNSENRWKKRGLRLVPMRWQGLSPKHYNVSLSVYHTDGSVCIVHGGVEIGQGINTRAAQICAYALNIPLEKIQVKATNTIFSANSDVTGGSNTTQYIGNAVLKCCQDLLKALEPVKSKMTNPTWEELIAQAYTDGVDLKIHGFVGPNDLQVYDIYGVTSAEVEIDVLTGELQVTRVDLYFDAGQSINPDLDIGQAEGGFVMGLGYWTTEQLVYDESGELLTDRPWNYYVPLARDIPLDFRLYLRKNSYSTAPILGSKSVGEPPMCMAVVILFAIREAVTAARAESGIPTTNWFPHGRQHAVRVGISRRKLPDEGHRIPMPETGRSYFDPNIIHGPATVEWTCLSTCTRTEDFKFY